MPVRRCSRFCGCRPKCKKFLTSQVCDRVRTSVRPLFAAFSEAAGRDGDQRIRSKSNLRALCSQRLTGFPDPDLFDHFAHSCHRLLTRPWHRSSQIYMNIMPNLQVPDLCNPRVSSASPRFGAPFCWPERSRPASWACAPTCVTASYPQ